MGVDLSGLFTVVEDQEAIEAAKARAAGGTRTSLAHDLLSAFQNHPNKPSLITVSAKAVGEQYGEDLDAKKLLQRLNPHAERYNFSAKAIRPKDKDDTDTVQIVFVQKDGDPVEPGKAGRPAAGSRGRGRGRRRGQAEGIEAEGNEVENTENTEHVEVNA